MKTTDDKKKNLCGDPEPILFEGNDPGIKAPSETAKPFMSEEGYVDQGEAQKE